MSIKKIIASIAASALAISALPILPIASAAGSKTVDVNITGAAVVRSQDTAFKNNFTGTNGTSTKDPENYIQIFSNKDGSQAGAYYKYNVPEYSGIDAKVELTITKQSTTAPETLRIISVGTDNIDEAYTTDNIFKDVSAAYTAKSDSNYIPVGASTDNKYTVDLTSVSQIGTNAIFIYTLDYNTSPVFYNVENPAIKLSYTPQTVVWRASDTSWSLSSGDRINGYANVSNGELTTTMVADNETSNYSGDVKTAFDSSSYHGAAPAVNANCNIMGMIATAGSASNYLFKANTTYTLHYTLSGSWTNKVTNIPNGAYLNLSTWTNAGTRKENLTNLNVTSTSAGVPITKTYEFTPSANCYAQFNFEFRRVKAGDTMTVSNIYVTTEQEIYTVSFNANGGTAVASQQVLGGDKAIEPAAPTREGCSFGGWYTDAALTTAYDFTAEVTGNLTLYAKWTSVTGDTLIEQKIDLTGNGVKIYRFPLTGGKYKYAEDVTSKSPYNALVDGVYTTDANIPANNYVMIDLGKEYNISTIKAYQNDIKTEGTGGNFVTVLPGCTGTTSTFVKADLQQLIRTNAAYNTLTTENGTNCFTYSLLTSERHNMGKHQYIILHNGGNYKLNLAEIEIYEDKTEKGAYLSVRNFYGDHMVLQRNKPHVIKGYSSKGTPVTVTMTEVSDPTNTRSETATPDSSGNWSVSIPAMKAGLSPYTITITDDNGGSRTLTDVLVGDVFLASGQSNMAYDGPKTASEADNVNDPRDSGYYRKGIYEKQIEIANPNIRMFKIRDDSQAESAFETENVPVWIDWCKSDGMMTETKSDLTTTSVTHENILALSTLMSFFANERVTAEPDIPVGVIQSSRGGSPIEIWSKGGRLYNNHIAPLEGLNVAGILWYQGCGNSNATGFTTYKDKFNALIKEYRRVLGNDQTTPFLFVQLAPFKNSNPEYVQAGSQRFQVMREIQRSMLDDPEVNTNLYMAVSMDTTENSHHDDAGNVVRASLIHPLGKDTLAKRMAAAYAEMKTPTGAVVNGPLVNGATANGRTVTVSFKDGTADGLKVLNPDYTYQHEGKVGWRSNATELEEFKLAGADGVYYNATAKVVGNTVQVTSAYVTEPKYVSYAYSEIPKNPNLGNGAGLPASPFNISVDGSAAPIATAETEAVTAFEITMNSNGGSKVEPQTVVSGKKAKQPTEPTLDGATFGGWYTDSGCTIAYDFDAPVTEAMTLYAKWTSAEPVVFSVEKESFTANDDADVYAYSFTAVVAGGKKVKLGAASGTKEKYFDTEFSGGTVYFGVLAPEDNVEGKYILQ